LGEVANIEAGVEARHGQAQATHVPVNLGLAVEMGHMRQCTVGKFGDMRERTPDQVLHADGLAGIGDVAALRYFRVFVHGFPEVGHREDGVRALEGRLERGRGEELGLWCVSMG
jgi:hypothetical protein